MCDHHYTRVYSSSTMCDHHYTRVYSSSTMCDHHYTVTMQLVGKANYNSTHVVQVLCIAGKHIVSKELTLYDQGIN